MSHNHYDVIIVGGGLVGASMALALSHFPLSIALIDASTRFSSDHRATEAKGSKILGLSHTSHNILKSLDIWPMVSDAASPIAHIHVSDQGHFGAVRFRAEKEGVEALGYTMRESTLVSALKKRLLELDNLTLMTGSKVTGLEQHEKYVTLTLDNNTAIESDLLVAADGARSTIRSLLDIGSQLKDYRQHAIVSSIVTEKAHQQTAYERFTPHGPIALLPLNDHECGVVMTVASDEIDAKMKLTDDAFIQALQSGFGYRLGRFSMLGKRVHYPLYWLKPDACVKDNIVFIGNAAHTVHPIAAQGFNLGLRDVAQLTEAISIQLKNHRPLYDAQWLCDYQLIRDKDQNHVLSFTDDLIHLFAKKLMPMVKGRTIGMLTVDLLPPLKQYLARKTMGFCGVTSKLAAGQPIEDLVYE